MSQTKAQLIDGKVATVEFSGGSASAPSIAFSGDTNTGIYSPGADQVAISTNGAGRLFVNSAGDVSIGRSSTSRQVLIYNDSFPVLQFANSTTGATSNDGLLIYQSGSDAAISNQEAGFIKLETNNQERLRITSAGLVGIGTSTPGATLSVDSASTALMSTYNSTNANGGYIELRSSGTVYGDVGTAAQLVSGGSASDFCLNARGSRGFALGTNNATRLYINSSGSVGIGTTAASAKLHVFGAGSSSNTLPANASAVFETDANAVVAISTPSANAAGLVFPRGTDAYYAGIERSGTDLNLRNNGSTRATIDSSGRLLVGTSSTFTVGADAPYAKLQVVGNTFSSAGPGLLALGRGELPTAITSGEEIGKIVFSASDGSQFGIIECMADANAGSGDYPSRLVFSTTADGASSPTERMRITNAGFLKASNSGSYGGATSSYHEIVSNQAASPNISINATSGSFTSSVLDVISGTAASTAYNLARFFSTNAGDLEFSLRGDGNAFADGTWTGGGADYAEYFEWSDGNPDVEDRRGISVVLDGDKIREALAGEDPIGVISGNPSIVGDAAWNKWTGKYLRDEFGTYILEDYEVTDDDGNIVIQQRRKLNPAYDPDVEYIPREQRPEWDCVGLMGKLRIRKGQITGSHWIKMRDINDLVEEWLVR